MIKFTLKMITTSALVLGIAATGIQLPVPDSDNKVIVSAVKIWNQLARNANAYFLENEDEIKGMVVNGATFAAEKATKVITEIGDYAEENEDRIVAKTENLSESAVNFYFEEKIK